MHLAMRASAPTIFPGGFALQTRKASALPHALGHSGVLRNVPGPFPAVSCRRR
jgi:hypothetical protein